MSPPLPSLQPAELRRYARHIGIPEFGLEGQRRLKASRVLCIGAGGLGSPVVMQLAAAGVGTIGLVDMDIVEESNLQRQLLHGTKDLGRAKLDSAMDRVRDINPHVTLEGHAVRFTRENAADLVSRYDLVIDGTDNFPTRYLSNDVCVFLKKPNIYGSILRFEGQCTVFAPHLGGPCYRCMAPQPPKPGLVPSCAEGGVLGVMPGLVGNLQATEAIKLLTGLGQPLLGRLLHVDALSMKFRTFHLQRDPQCPVCGDTPTIKELIDYDQFCQYTPPNPAMSQSNTTDIPEISVRDLHDLRDRKTEYFHLDVREPEEYATGHIAGAVLIPLGELPERLNEIPKNSMIVAQCRSGGRSGRAVAFLKEAGYEDVWNLAGGIIAWSGEIDSSIKY